MSGPVPLKPGAVLAAVNTAARHYHGSLRLVLTAAARAAFLEAGRGEETAI